MIPDFEKMNERMEQASLKELMPDFDKEQEWSKIVAQLNQQKKRKIIPIWSYAAAILLLLIGGTWIAVLSGSHKQQPTVSRSIPQPGAAATIASDNAKHTEDTFSKAIAIITDTTNNNKTVIANKKSRTGIICNGTPCPIQICITQTMKCPNIEPAAISSCSTLEPDQSGKLSYKAHDSIAKNCSLTINEIEIKSIATGEVILLTANSTPSTAQEVFSYITGQKKGDILAGMFNSDCNKKTRKHNLRLNNSYGSLIIQ